MINIGTIEGHDVIHDTDNGVVLCKNQEIPVKGLIDAYHSPFDRVNVKKNLVLRKHEDCITLGCFTITLLEAKNLIKKLS